MQFVCGNYCIYVVLVMLAVLYLVTVKYIHNCVHECLFTYIHVSVLSSVSVSVCCVCCVCVCVYQLFLYVLTYKPMQRNNVPYVLQKIRCVFCTIQSVHARPVVVTYRTLVLSSFNVCLLQQDSNKEDFTQSLNEGSRFGGGAGAVPSYPSNQRTVQHNTSSGSLSHSTPLTREEFLRQAQSEATRNNSVHSHGGAVQNDYVRGYVSKPVEQPEEDDRYVTNVHARFVWLRP